MLTWTNAPLVRPLAEAASRPRSVVIESDQQFALGKIPGAARARTAAPATSLGVGKDHCSQIHLEQSA
jgi:hypothetical protein